MTLAAGIASSDGALLEMPFQDVATREGIFAKTAGIRSYTSICIAIRMSSGQ